MTPATSTANPSDPHPIHVWELGLATVTDREAAAAARLLTEDEASRARQYLHPQARRAFVLTRSALRQLLGTHLNLDPQRVPIEAGPHGKPRLAPAANPNALSFNVAHCADLTLLALARHRNLGIDVERRDPLPDLEVLAARILAATELARWRCLSGPDQIDAFLQAWTRKEALLKASGLGLALDPRHVAALPEAPCRPCPERLVELPQRGVWRLLDLHTASGRHAAALAYDGPAASIVGPAPFNTRAFD